MSVSLVALRCVSTGVACILGLSGTWMVLLFYAGTGIFLCTLHAIFRPRTLRSKANRVAEDVKASGGFTIEVLLIRRFFWKATRFRVPEARRIGSPSGKVVLPPMLFEIKAAYIFLYPLLPLLPFPFPFLSIASHDLLACYSVCRARKLSSSAHST